MPEQHDSAYLRFGLAAFGVAAVLQVASFSLAHHGEAAGMLRLSNPALTSQVDGFDGQFFLALADDPLVGAATADALDSPVLRATRIGYPLAAHLAAPFAGGTRYSLLILQTLSAGALILLIQLAARDQGLNPALCVAAPVALPFVLSLELVTAELPTAAALLCAAEADRRRRPLISAGAVALACLTKETAAIAALAFVLSSLAARRFGQALLYFASLAPLAIWYTYLLLHFPGAASTGSLSNNLTSPGLGIVAAVSAHATALAGAATAKTLGLLATLLWYLVGAGLAVGIAVRRRLTTGRVLMCLSSVPVLLLSYGAPSYAYDEIFNFARQLFLLAVGALFILYYESSSLSPGARWLLSAWLAAGAVLGVAWWLQEIATLCLAA